MLNNYKILIYKQKYMYDYLLYTTIEYLNIFIYYKYLCRLAKR